VHRRYVLTALAVVAAGTVALPAAQAAPPKGFSKTVKFTDPTPDPTGGAIATGDICKGAVLPMEAGVPVTIPAVGKLKVEISGFQGDWALSIRDSKGNFVAGDDVNPPDAFEVVTAKIKKPGKYLLTPCNLGGTPEATMKYTYTPS
jgi:hypothetical protein